MSTGIHAFSSVKLKHREYAIVHILSSLHDMALYSPIYCVNLDFCVICFCSFIFFMWHSEGSLCCAISFPRASMKLDTLGRVLLESAVSTATVLG